MDNGEDAYREGLARDNQGLIFKIMRNGWGILSGDPREKDYITAGYIGLVKAANSFDKSRGYEFSTLACRCITNEFNIKFKRDKTQKERMWKRMGSMEYVDVDGSSRSYDFLDEESGPYDLAEKADYISLARSMIDDLPKRDRRIIELRIGGMNAREVSEIISEEFGKVTTQGIRIRYGVLIEKIRRKFNREIRLGM
jgi:RNA polymerase sporulation-specific sigma factor